jgi:UDP-glucoronosyl and UDP-glucosyl transferase
MSTGSWTTGGTDPADLGTPPANVRIERYVAQSHVLPRCAAVVCHAGFNTLIGAFAHGLPALCLPLAADHPINAQLCAEAGAGLDCANAPAIDARGPLVDPDTLHPNEVASALSRQLDDPTFTSAARRIADEIRGMPEPAEAARFLEQVVGSRVTKVKVSPNAHVLDRPLLIRSRVGVEPTEDLHLHPITWNAWANAAKSCWISPPARQRRHPAWPIRSRC